uniref:ZP domain-containing protein n=1 Tax=Anopheles farauti TaxID=69004 RepID=A0A182Q663_9DIPT
MEQLAGRTTARTTKKPQAGDIPNVGAIRSEAEIVSRGRFSAKRPPLAEEEAFNISNRPPEWVYNNSLDIKINGSNKAANDGSATIFTKEPTVRIQCQSGSMLITIKDAPANLNGQFSGMVYPKGLAKNSTCLTEYHEQEGPLRYKLPLKSCNTMPIETLSEGGYRIGLLLGHFFFRPSGGHLLELTSAVPKPDRLDRKRVFTTELHTELLELRGFKFEECVVGEECYVFRMTKE